MKCLETKNLVDQAIEARMRANRWSSESLTQYFCYHIDGALESGFADDGISNKIAAANRQLKVAFAGAAYDVTSDDIQSHLDKVLSKDKDWAAHFDIALTMAQANPAVVSERQMRQVSDLLGQGLPAGPKSAVMKDSCTQKAAEFPKPRILAFA